MRLVISARVLHPYETVMEAPIRWRWAGTLWLNVAGSKCSGEPPPKRPSKRATLCPTSSTPAPGLRFSKENKGKPKTQVEEPSHNSSGEAPPNRLSKPATQTSNDLATFKRTQVGTEGNALEPTDNNRRETPPSPPNRPCHISPNPPRYIWGTGNG